MLIKVMETNKNMSFRHEIKLYQFKNEKTENGFSLIEVMIALVILLIAVVGVFTTFTYATIYNGGNSQRSQALSVSQQQIELLRSAKFTPTIMDSSLEGGIKPPVTVRAADGFRYLVEITVDDDPFTPGFSPRDDTKTLKEITVIITPQSITGSWVVAYPTKAIVRRARAN
jgi:prepilin-type N-terminal cleavage/methylation domain-containing protein